MLKWQRLSRELLVGFLEKSALLRQRHYFVIYSFWDNMSVGLQCLIYIFAVLINKVCLQVTEEGFVGGSVILQCSSTEHPPNEDINVHWRDKNGKIVFDIIKGEDSLEKQNQQYKKRVISFPAGYKSGNFSIKLNNLNQTDAGEFSCRISHSSEEKTILLRINETKAENRSKSSEGGEKPTPDAEVASTVLKVFGIIIGILTGVVVVVAASYFIYQKRKKKNTPTSSLTSDETDKIN